MSSEPLSDFDWHEAREVNGTGRPPRRISQGGRCEVTEKVVTRYEVSCPVDDCWWSDEFTDRREASDAAHAHDRRHRDPAP